MVTPADHSGAAGRPAGLIRRGRRAGAASLAEAACPACLAVALLAERPGEVRAVLDESAVPGPALGQG